MHGLKPSPAQHSRVPAVPQHSLPRPRGAVLPKIKINPKSFFGMKVPEQPELACCQNSSQCWGSSPCLGLGFIPLLRFIPVPSSGLILLPALVPAGLGAAVGAQHPQLISQARPGSSEPSSCCSHTKHLCSCCCLAQAPNKAQHGRRGAGPLPSQGSQQS